MHRLNALLLVFLFAFTAPAAFAEKELSALLEDWLTAENSINYWHKNEISSAHLLSDLEHFCESLETYTGSLLFSQYERIGLLPHGSGISIRRQTDLLINTVKTAIEDTSEKDKVAEESEAATFQEITILSTKIREELISWLHLESDVSSRILSRYAGIFGIFLLCIIILTGVALFLYRALRHSRIQEHNSAEFSRITMMAQEKERTIISAELHDTVLQDMGRLLQMSEASSSSSELTRKIMEKTREICISMMPPDFSRLALADSLKQLCVDFEKRTSIECRPIITEDFRADLLPPKLQLQIYRIVQEALSNIEKHSKANEVTLTARNKDEKTILVCITDDGIGLSGNKSGASMGIHGMYQRAAILKASLSFVPGAGSGLTLRLEVPLSSDSTG